MEHDPYEILDVKKHASQEEIKKAYRSLLMEWHEDKWVNASESEQLIAKEKFEFIQEAFNIVGDVEKRKLYDETGYITPETNRLKSQILSALRTLITGYLSRGPDILQLDIIKEITTYCNGQINQNTKDIKTLKAQKYFLQIVISRFRRKQKLNHDFLSDIFRTELNNLDQTINANIDLILTYSEVKSIINAYEFNHLQFVTDGIEPDVEINRQVLGNIFDLAREMNQGD